MVPGRTGRLQQHDTRDETRKIHPSRSNHNTHTHQRGGAGQGPPSSSLLVVVVGLLPHARHVHRLLLLLDGLPVGVQLRGQGHAAVFFGGMGEWVG